MMTKKHIKQALIFTIATAFVFVGCDKNFLNKKKGSAGSSISDPAVFTVRMHDTAGPYSQVNIEILEATIHMEDSNSSGWVPLNINPGVYDLLELQNGLDTILVNPTALQPGFASQLRLMLGDSNWVVLSDSITEHPLSTPSAQSSGLKINIHETLMANTQYELILDFDANKSIVVTGNEQYKLKPVIKVDSLVAN